MRPMLGKLFCHRVFRVLSTQGIHNIQCIDVSPRVEQALKVGKAVVALESTIITHGMPYPQNLETAMAVEEAVCAQGAVPATIAIIKGRIKVGLEQDMLSYLASLKTRAIKTSRRDFPYVLSKGLNGGTTVSGTIAIANLVGIMVFATGGMGGVHREGQVTMDVSTDLTELGRSPLLVVSSGVKSILDIGRTLEYLETQGVCVATYGSNRIFPAFYSSQSEFQSPYNVETPLEAANLFHSLLQLKLSSGLLLAVPIPEENALEGDKIEEAIQSAVQDAAKARIIGKDLTPYVLGKVNQLTFGKSLLANMALVKNNANVAAQVAVELANLRGESNPERNRATPTKEGEQNKSNKQQIVVVGGSVLDCITTVKEDAIKPDGRMHRGDMRQFGGGVGRNMADALGRLGLAPLLLSCVGRDQFGQYLLDQSLEHVDTSGVTVLDEARTASCSVIVNRAGECHFGIGDMDIHDHITPQMVEKFSKQLSMSPLVIIDGNIPEETIHYTLDCCKEYGVPVWFEPTDVRKAAKPFNSSLWKTISFISPNISELRTMVKAAGLSAISYNDSSSQYNYEDIVTEVAFLARSLAEHIGTCIITMGRLGVMIVRRGGAEDPLSCETSQPVSARLYPAPCVPQLVNVTGAGDCFAAGFVAAMLQNLPESVCASVGTANAALALQSSAAVPSKLLLPHNPEWVQKTLYQIVV